MTWALSLLKFLNPKQHAIRTEKKKNTPDFAYIFQQWQMNETFKLFLSQNTLDILGFCTLQADFFSFLFNLTGFSL